ncbi:MAG TPA: SDR family oxidoreductase [Noviherbaspirillum sp.]
MKAILTGHTRGIGAAIAAQLLSRDIPVLGLSRTSNAELGARHAALQQVELDLADAAAVAGWIAGGALDAYLKGCATVLLINNAGVVQPIGPLETQDLSTIARAVALNVTAPLMLSAAVAQAAPDASDRRILHVSSGAARNAYPGWSVYCATKAALDHHARAVVLDNNRALRICSLAPGVIDTDMQAELRATPLERFPIRERFDSMKQQGQLTSPEACAQRLVNYLLGDGFGQNPVADLREMG